MSTNTLETAYANGQTIDASHINELTSSLLGSVVGRNTSGVPEPLKSLGTAAIPWGAIYGQTLILDGSALDTSLITSAANRIVSGKTRADSSQPQFIKPDGSVATMTVEGLATDLVTVINAATVSVSTDLITTGLTLGPAATNTALVNGTDISSDKYAGEVDYNKEGVSGINLSIPLDTMGANFSSRVGQIVAVKGTTEIMLGYLESTTKLTGVRRGYFFDSAQTPVVREAISNNDVLTILELGWVFLEDNATTVDVTYLTPVVSNASPGSPATGQYWFDITNQVWKRYSGITFEVINRTLIGIVCLDDTACIGARSLDFSKAFSEMNTVLLEKESDEIVRARNFHNKISVYGRDVIFSFDRQTWNITTDLDTAVVEANDTIYYFYLSEDGKQIISDERPYFRPELCGHYHPYQTWRCVGSIDNDSSGNFDEDFLFDDKYNSHKTGVVGGAFGVSSNPTTTSTGAIVMPDMDFVIDSMGGPAVLVLTTSWTQTSNAAFGMTISIRVDGVTTSKNMTTQVASVNKETPKSACVAIPYLAPGRHRIQGYWSTAGGTAKLIGNNRNLTCQIG